MMPVGNNTETRLLNGAIVINYSSASSCVISGMVASRYLLAGTSSSTANSISTGNGPEIYWLSHTSTFLFFEAFNVIADHIITVLHNGIASSLKFTQSQYVTYNVSGYSHFWV
jgi:hypothetical protein